MWYSFAHPINAGMDQLSPGKLPTQAQIAALTGVGYFLKDYKTSDTDIDPRRLDLVIQGPMETRLEFFAAILKFDRTVIQAAIFSDLLNGSPESEKFYEDTYKEQADEFYKTKPGEKDKRKEIVDFYIRQKYAFGNFDERQIKRIYANLKLYEDNETNIALAEKRNLIALLSSSSTLPVSTRKYLYLSLQAGKRVKLEGNEDILSPEEMHADNVLCHQKGCCESLVDIPSSYQAAQKIGQAFSFIIGGAYSVALLKVLVAFVTLCTCLSFIIFVGPTEDNKARGKYYVSLISVTGAIINIFGTAFAGLVAAFAYHHHIVVKASQRAEGSTDMPLPNCPTSKRKRGVIFRSWGFTNQNCIQNFKTLASAPVMSGDNNFWVYNRTSEPFANLKPLIYKKPSGLLKNIGQQLFAYDPFKVNIFSSIPVGQLVIPRSFEDSSSRWMSINARKIRVSSIKNPLASQLSSEKAINKDSDV
jgi:hypothetical protein